jgi:hypothetical protein
LLLAAAKSDGIIVVVEGSAETHIQAGDEQFVEEQTPREVARWKFALSQLDGLGLIENPGSNDGDFEVTHAGHELADQLANKAEE